MADTEKPDITGFKLPDPAEIGRSMADIAERSQRIVGEWLKRQANEEHALGITFWASREVAERLASTRSEFRERVLSIAGVRIEEVVDYDFAFARFSPGFAPSAT